MMRIREKIKGVTTESHLHYSPKTSTGITGREIPMPSLDIGYFFLLIVFEPDVSFKIMSTSTWNLTLEKIF